MKIREYLREKPLLFDGAMGTFLAKKYPDIDIGPCEMLNLLQPEMVCEVHKEYIRAGAVAIKTNTFAVDSEILNHDKAAVEKMIRSGFEIACQAVSESEGEQFVFADIGPAPQKEGIDAFVAYQQAADIFSVPCTEFFV